MVTSQAQADGRKPIKVVVAVGGASGSIYARRLIDALAGLRATGSPIEVGVVFSRSGEQVWAHELGNPADLPFRKYARDDFSAPFASGSASWDAMVVVPCSSGGLARIAHGVSNDLIGRAADVMLKERRKLILVFRETPLSLVHIENMAAVTRAGAVVMPAAPSFYSAPSSWEALVDTVVARVLDHIGLENKLMPRWGDST